MILYIIRHGETDWNCQRKMQGQSDIALNEKGRAAAQKTREGLQKVSFDLGITSPLKRARETAEIILKGREIPLLEERRIMELGFGEGEGLACVKDKQSKEPDPNFNYFFAKPECYVPPKGGETLEDLYRRESVFLEELFRNPTYQDSTILISTHGAALCGLLRILKGNPVEKFWQGGLHKNCGFSVVRVTDGKPEILQEAVLLYKEEELISSTAIDSKEERVIH